MNKILFILAFLFFTPIVNADIISINSGGTGNVIINPAEIIEGFFSCVPDTCAELGYNCGTWSDGCGRTLDCGTCASGYTCSSGTCTAIPPSGGGGAIGGGTEGGGVPSAECDLVTTSSSINIDLKIETNQIRVISVKNIGTTTINLIPKQIQNLDKYSIIFDPQNLSLGPGETKELTLRIVAFNETGTFTDTIEIGCSNVLSGINIKTKLLLFDSNIIVLNKDYRIPKGEKLKTQVTLIPMGDPERLDVTLNYVIKDYSNKVYLTQSETVLAEKQIEFKKNFDTGGLPLGKYIVGLELVYPGGVAPSSAHFEVVERTPESFLTKIVIYLIVAVLVVGILIILLLIIRRRRRNSEAEQR